jgi:hypothetical protein
MLAAVSGRKVRGLRFLDEFGIFTLASHSIANNLRWLVEWPFLADMGSSAASLAR